MPDLRSRRFFGMVLVGAILALGALAPLALEYARGQVAGTNLLQVNGSYPTQAHYRWRNDDGGEQAAALNWATTSPSWSEVFFRAAMDDQYLYVSGHATNTNIWVIEKRSITNGALVFATTSIAGDADTIAVDDQYIYIAGDNAAGKWVIQKRNKSNGALVYTVSSTAGTDGASYPGSITVVGSAMYVAGSGGTNPPMEWRIEKRNLSDGSFVSSFASSGVLIVMSDFGSFAPAADADRSGTYLYSSGDIGGASVVKIAQSNGAVIYQTSTSVLLTAPTIVLSPDDQTVFIGGVSNGCNCNWALEARSASSGALLWSTSTNFGATSTIDYPMELDADNTYLYVVGGEDTPSMASQFERIRFEKRLQSNGHLVYATTSDPTAGADTAWGIAMNGQQVFLVGQQDDALSGYIESRTLGHDTSTATFKGAEDSLTSILSQTVMRLRMLFENQGNLTDTTRRLRLEYATSTGGPWTAVGGPASSTHFIYATSSYVTSTQGTHNISGLTDPTSTPAAWYSGQVMTRSNQQSQSTTLGASQFGEFEWGVKATSTAQAGVTYYFRATDAGTAINSYPVYAQTSVTSPLAVTAVSVNSGAVITPVGGATISTTVSYTVSGGNGCYSVFYNPNRVTSTLFRSGVSSTCAISSPSFNYLNCYVVTTSTHNCPNDSSTYTYSANATATFDVWYFAEATDNNSSSFQSENWLGFVAVSDGSSTATSTAASGVELNSITAIALATSSLSYGSIVAGANTSSTNQSTTVRNVGNTSTTLQVSGSAMSNGSYNMPTSSQHYATSTFTYGGGEQLLQETAQTVSGWLVQKAPLGNNWDTTTPLRAISAYHSAVVSNGFLYVTGGNSIDSALWTSTVQYAPINATGSLGTWATTTALPSTLADHSAVVSNGFIYVTGGYNGSAYTSTVQYAPINAAGSLGAWTTTTPLRSILAYHSAAVVSNGFIYVTGGYNGSAYTSTVQYAPINATGSLGAWTTTTPLRAISDQHSAVVSNGFLYVTGGGNGPFTSTVQYAPINASGSLGAWATTTPLRAISGGHSAVVSNGFLNVTGGYNGSTYTSTVQYAPINASGSLGAWATITPLLSGLSVHSAVVSNGFLYVTGGRATLYTSTVQYAALPTKDLYWGLGVPATSTGGYYSSTITYTAVYSP